MNNEGEGLNSIQTLILLASVVLLAALFSNKDRIFEFVDGLSQEQTTPTPNYDAVPYSQRWHVKVRGLIQDANTIHGNMLNAAQELTCLQQNIYFESRDQSYAGQVAIASVTMVRVKHKAFPSTVCGVVKSGRYVNGQIKRNACAFSWYCDGKSDTPNLNNIVERRAWISAKELALEVYFGRIKLDTQATHYHNDTVEPYWIADNRISFIEQIDKHLFYVEVL